MFTEAFNPKTETIDQLSALEIVRLINEEDQRVATVIHAALPQIAAAIDAAVAAFAQGGRLIYIGAGTSGRLGVLDAVECVPTFNIRSGQVQGILAGGDRAMMHSVEAAEDNPEGGENDLRAAGLTARDVVVGIAASGHTPYVLGALKYASQIGAVTVGVSCNSPAPVLDLATIPIPLPVGAEVITGSTRMKAGSAQKMALNMISTGAMIRSGKVYGNLMVDVQVINEKLVKRAVRIVQKLTDLDETAARALLRDAGNNAKVAIVMARRATDAATARRLLDEAGGFLRTVIGS